MKHQFLEGEIERVFKEYKGRYGSPRITLQLYEEGIETNKRVVAVLMRKIGLYAKGYHRRKASYGLSKNIETAVQENLLNREFNQEPLILYGSLTLLIYHVRTVDYISAPI